jgi:pyrroloquinoline-quinone synthase
MLDTALDKAVDRIDQLSHPAGKNDFVSAVVESKGDRRMLGAFARQYHFFSIMQANLIPALIQCFPPTDTRALAELSEILADEYGNGKPDKVHSEIFKKFARAVGVNTENLPIAAHEVLPGIHAYLDGIKKAYTSGDLARVLAAYSFLERSAVHSYAPLLAAFREVGLDEEDLLFFPLHVELEPEHAETAVSFVRSRLTSQDELDRFEKEVSAFGERWASFWSDLNDAAHQAIH